LDLDLELDLDLDLELELEEGLEEGLGLEAFREDGLGVFLSVVLSFVLDGGNTLLVLLRVRCRGGGALGATGIG